MVVLLLHAITLAGNDVRCNVCCNEGALVSLIMSCSVPRRQGITIGLYSSFNPRVPCAAVSAT